VLVDIHAAGLNFEQGAEFLATHAAGYHALWHCTVLKPGETVLVLGAAGGAGSAAVARTRRSTTSSFPCAKQSGPLPTARVWMWFTIRLAARRRK